MHVTDVTMFYAPQSGGVRRYVEAKRAWLTRHVGFSHSLVIPDIGTAEDGAVFVRSLSIPGSNGYRLPFGASGVTRAIVGQRPDIVEAGDPFMARAAIRAAQRLQVPAVAFCHADLPRVFGARFGAGAERVAARYYAASYRSFDLVLAPSRGVSVRLQEWGIASARHQPLGVDLDVFNPSRCDRRLREQMEIRSDSRLVAFAGRLAPEKNLDVLVDAMRRLGAPYVALLIGGGTAPAALPDNVRVLQYVSSRERLATLLASCDAFVHAGDQETFGLAVLEAMACGLPVVGADAAGIAELVSSDFGVLVPPRNSGALADAITSLFERDLTALGVAARRRAERYAWTRVIPEIVAQYELLSSRRAAARSREPAAINV